MKTYPKVIRVENDESEVLIRFEGVLNKLNEDNRWTYPLTLRVIPHDNKIYISVNNMEDKKITLEQHSPGTFYINIE